VLRLLGFLLVLWLVVSVIGAIIDGLFWLAVLGALFFLVTAVLGWNKRRSEVGGGRRALG
jgi:hypothetical protein